MKVCFKCGEKKPLDQFYKHAAMADGHLGKCKDCTKADVAARIERKKKDPKWMAAERARGRTKQQAYRKAGTAVKTTPETRARWAANNEHKRKAQRIAYYAIKTGTLVRPKKCQRCKCSGREIEMHHPDYSKPLLVEWLCTECHGLTRRK